jgi:GNAT superfamily N-acetyltransferase
VTVRRAALDDVDLLVRIVNAAFVVERFFVDRDRTDAEAVRAYLSTGTFLVAQDESGTPVGCVYIERRGDRGYFGLLAIDPAHQGHGYGRRLIDAVERLFRSTGCVAVDIRVVNLRTELPPIYLALGYVERGTEPFEDPQLLKPAHFILMSKAL